MKLLYLAVTLASLPSGSCESVKELINESVKELIFEQILADDMATVTLKYDEPEANFTKEYNQDLGYVMAGGLHHLNSPDTKSIDNAVVEYSHDMNDRNGDMNTMAYGLCEDRILTEMHFTANGGGSVSSCADVARLELCDLATSAGLSFTEACPASCATQSGCASLWQRGDIDSHDLTHSINEEQSESSDEEIFETQIASDHAQRGSESTGWWRRRRRRRRGYYKHKFWLPDHRATMGKADCCHDDATDDDQPVCTNGQARCRCHGGIKNSAPCYVQTTCWFELIGECWNMCWVTDCNGNWMRRRLLGSLPGDGDEAEPARPSASERRQLLETDEGRRHAAEAMATTYYNLLFVDRGTRTIGPMFSPSTKFDSQHPEYDSFEFQHLTDVILAAMDEERLGISRNGTSQRKFNRIRELVNEGKKLPFKKKIGQGNKDAGSDSLIEFLGSPSEVIEQEVIQQGQTKSSNLAALLQEDLSDDTKSAIDAHEKLGVGWTCG